MTTFDTIWIFGLLIYQIGIYIPRVREYKRKERFILMALPSDIFLELPPYSLFSGMEKIL